MKMLKEKNGFTLVELAVVLVIIGIIIAAALKGQDLIEGAKRQEAISGIKSWEVPMWTHYALVKKFPGDTSPVDGLIDSFSALKTALDDEKMTYPPDQIADLTFEIKYVTGACGNTNAKRNVMLIKGDVPIKTIEAIDLAIDGTISGKKGRIRNCGAGGTSDPGDWPSAATYTITYLFDKLP